MKYPYKYQNANLDIETRVEDLLKRMTLEEKITQMRLSGYNRLENLKQAYEAGETIDLGATFVFHDFDVETYNAVQRYQVERSRLHIPFILACENTHGVSNPLCTIFPTTGCMAATFDDKLVGRAASASAKEARALGITQVYSPNIDISWDLRWGRVEENFGEDPYLTSKMGVALVKNYQKNGVAATVKHYIAYGLGEEGINIAPAHVGERDIREYMLPPFEACIKEGKAWSIMPSYNEVDGVPVHASKFWMKDVLRGELGFDGMVVTDYGAADMLKLLHRTYEDPVDVGTVLCDNEIDVEASDVFGYNDAFFQRVREKKYPMSKIDACVRNVLRLKFRLGLFENPYAQIEKLAKIHNKKHVALAKEIADKGIVLLKNDGLLPLSMDKKIAVIGPNATISQMGNYMFYHEMNPQYSGKCVADECKTLPEVCAERGMNFSFAHGSTFAYTDEKMLQEACQAAMDADVVVLALGHNSKGGAYAGNVTGQGERITELAVTSGEGYDVDVLELTPPQKALFDRVSQLGKPIVMVLYGGRPTAITEQVARCAAILYAFGAGEQGSESIVDILFGKVNPSGKLPISIPRSTGALPCYYNHKPSARGNFCQRAGSYEQPGKDYVFGSPKALFPFGYGLSYTTFAYRDLEIEKKSRYAYRVRVKVINVGERAGEESVLLFLSAAIQRVTPVVKKLRAFKRISLEKGEEKTVEFTLGKQDFTYVDIDMKKGFSTGKHTLFIGDLEGRIVIK